MLSFTRPTARSDRGSLISLGATSNAVPHSSSSMHSMLDSYSRQIEQAERLIIDTRQQQQEVLEETVAAKATLAAATAEAQAAEEVTASLAAELHQLQLEIAAKQADVLKLKAESTSIAELCAAVDEEMRQERRNMIQKCQQLDEILMQMQHAAAQESQG